MAKSRKKPAAPAAPSLNRKERDRAIVISAVVVLGILFLLGMLAPSLISMRSTVAAAAGFLLLAACLVGIALIIDRLLLRFWR